MKEECLYNMAEASSNPYLLELETKTSSCFCFDQVLSQL